MKNSEKLSRQELLQQDRIQKTLYRFVNHLHKQQKSYWTGTIAGVLGILSVWAGFEYQKAAKRERAVLFFTARSTLNRTDLSPQQKRDQAITGFQHFLETGKDSSLGAIARLYMGRLLFEEERIQEAQAAYQQVMEHPNTSELLKNAVNLSLVALHEHQRDWLAAHEILDRFKAPRWNDLRLFTEARLTRQQGLHTESQNYLKELLRDAPDSVYRETAETQLLLH